MKLVEVNCEECGSVVQKPFNEFNRSKRLGRRFFCNKKCANIYINRNRKALKVIKTCPLCAKMFQSDTKKKSKTYCSFSCASKDSMSESRREAQRQAGIAHSSNLLSPHGTLKIRESWKYKNLEDALLGYYDSFEFEYRLDSYVFDLAIFDLNLLIEFDGPHHRRSKHSVSDSKKDQYAVDNGFSVIRIGTKPNCVIPVDVIVNL